VNNSDSGQVVNTLYHLKKWIKFDVSSGGICGVDTDT